MPAKGSASGKGKGKQGKQTSAWMEGDWACRDCRVHLFKWKEKCYQCGKDKAEVAVHDGNLLPPNSLAGKAWAKMHREVERGGGWSWSARGNDRAYDRAPEVAKQEVAESVSPVRGIQVGTGAMGSAGPAPGLAPPVNTGPVAGDGRLSGSRSQSAEVEGSRRSSSLPGTPVSRDPSHRSKKRRSRKGKHQRSRSRRRRREREEAKVCMRVQADVEAEELMAKKRVVEDEVMRVHGILDRLLVQVHLEDSQVLELMRRVMLPVRARGLDWEAYMQRMDQR